MFEKLTADFQVEMVFANHDYEPYAKERDERVEKFLQSKKIKLEGQPNNLIESIKKDGRLKISNESLDTLLTPSNFTGFASEQVDDYLTNVINPLLDRNKEFIVDENVELNC